MAQDPLLRVAVSTRALFDLEKENEIFMEKGPEEYIAYQMAHEHEILPKGPAFSVIEALLRLNDAAPPANIIPFSGGAHPSGGSHPSGSISASGGSHPSGGTHPSGGSHPSGGVSASGLSREAEGASLSAIPTDGKRVEILIMSRNSAEVSLRIFHSIEAYGLDIRRASFTTGRSIVPYLTAFHTDLYLSADEKEVSAAIGEGIAAGLILSDGVHMTDPIGELRIAFDGDAVLFSGEAEQVFREGGVEAFCESERRQAKQPLSRGPFAGFLSAVAALQQEFPCDAVPVRTALVTARSAPAHERVIRTLRTWGIRIDEAFFLGGEDKRDVLRAFGAHIYFDDNASYVESAKDVVLSARVVYPESLRQAG